MLRLICICVVAARNGTREPQKTPARAGPYLWANPRAASLRSKSVRGLGLFWFPTSPRGSAPLARCAREAAPYGLTLGIAELRRPPPRPPLKRSSYAGSSGGVGGALVGSARLCCGGVPPLPPCGGRLCPRGAPFGCTNPPAGPLARAPWALSPTSRPSAVFDVRCRLVRYPLGCAAPSVSWPWGGALRRLRPPVTSLSRSLRLTARASRPLCFGGVAPSAASAKPPPPYLVCVSMVLRSMVLCLRTIKVKKNLIPQPILDIICVTL